MNSRAKLMCFVLLAGTSLTTTQSESVLPVVDVSHSGAPLKVTGTVTANDQSSEVPRYSFAANVAMTNVSAKPILLMLVTLDIVSALPMSLNYLEEEDYFFEPRPLQPQSSAMLQRVLGKFGEPSRKDDLLAKVRSSAHAKVIFVQFSDGSSWGDAVAAERSLSNRQKALERLEVLDEVYRNRGKKEFLNQLLQPTLLQPIFSLQYLYHQKGDLTLVLANLDNMLQTACARSSQHGLRCEKQFETLGSESVQLTCIPKSAHS